MSTPRSSTVIENSLWKKLGSISQSPSHDHWHIDHVLRYAKALSDIYGADLDIVTAAVILHDLGRIFPELKSRESAEKSATLATGILRSTSLFSDDEIEQIIIAIKEHDQENLRPSTLAGRILKDADFLAGFGAWGIVRIAMWAAERRSSAIEIGKEDLEIGGVEQFFQRLNEKMPQRLAGLEFPESRRIAKKEMALARLFNHLLHKPPDLESMHRQGLYIVLEGISGSGKDTQALELQSRLRTAGIRSTIVAEPTELYKNARELWAENQRDPWIQAFLLMASRYLQISDITQPLLDKKEVVLSVRNYVSTIVYQGSQMNERELVDYVHGFAPVPDVVFILDIDAAAAFKRCQDRAAKDKSRTLSNHENHQSLELLRQEYLKMAASRVGEDFIVIDGNRPLVEVADDIWNELVTRGLLETFQ